MSRPSDMPRTEQLDAARAAAWDGLRDLALWGGTGTPLHEEGRRIVALARQVALTHPEQVVYANAMDVIDPHGTAYPVAITAAWGARKANA